MPDTAVTTTLEELAAEVSRLREEVADARRLARRAEDRGQVENLFNRYMHLHNAFQDEQIIPLWVKRVTPGIRARYTNAGQYTGVPAEYHPYHPSTRQTLEPAPPVLHETFTDTFK
ncbi:hypothetical protein GCM10009819_06790 [Agromyces tropicus]|uniref:Uncharacterized protein n=1 Tax=Agromyces tropicus TaxID=555371 RepID=A0ABP5FH27_9MICO